MADDVVRIRTGACMSHLSQTTREDVVEIPRAEWDAMTSEEREQRLEQITDETLENEVQVWAYVDEEG